MAVSRFGRLALTVACASTALFIGTGTSGAADVVDILPPGQNATVSGGDCVAGEGDTEAPVVLVAVVPSGSDTPVLGPVEVAPTAEGDWEWSFQAPATYGDYSVLATCVTYVGLADYEPWEIRVAEVTQPPIITDPPPPATPTLTVDRQTIREGEPFRISGTGCIPLSVERPNPYTPRDLPGAWYFVDGHIDPSTTATAADGTWSAQTTAISRNGKTVTISATCVQAAGQSFEYQSITLPWVGKKVVDKQDDTGGKKGDARRLSDTGVEAGSVGLLGLGLAAAGALALAAGRRRSADSV